MIEILIKSIASGVVVAGVLTATKLLGPRIGGVLAGIPLVFTLSFLFATYKPESRIHVGRFLYGGLWSAGLLGVFVGVLWLFNSHTRLGYAGSLICSYVVWIVLCLLCFQLFLRNSP